MEKSITISAIVFKLCVLVFALWLFSSITNLNSEALDALLVKLAMKAQQPPQPDIAKAFIQMLVAIVTFITHSFWTAWWVPVSAFVVSLFTYDRRHIEEILAEHSKE